GFYRKAEPGKEVEREYLSFVGVAGELQVEFTLGILLDHWPVFEQEPKYSARRRLKQLFLQSGMSGSLLSVPRIVDPGYGDQTTQLEILIQKHLEAGFFSEGDRLFNADVILMVPHDGKFA